MSIRPILDAGHPALHQATRPVSAFDKSLHRLLDEMLLAMRAAEGIGLAANQIGVPLQVALIEINGVLTELVNPKLVGSSGEQFVLEGCLSLPGYTAEVVRYAEVTVAARDRYGTKFSVTGSELLARALQHETDHLLGHLYIDRLSSLGDLVRIEPAPLTEEAANTDSPSASS